MAPTVENKINEKSKAQLNRKNVIMLKHSDVRLSICTHNGSFFVKMIEFIYILVKNIIKKKQDADNNNGF